MIRLLAASSEWWTIWSPTFSNDEIQQSLHRRESENAFFFVIVHSILKIPNHIECCDSPFVPEFQAVLGFHREISPYLFSDGVFGAGSRGLAGFIGAGVVGVAIGAIARAIGAVTGAIGTSQTSPLSLSLSATAATSICITRVTLSIVNYIFDFSIEFIKHPGVFYHGESTKIKIILKLIKKFLLYTF